MVINDISNGRDLPFDKVLMRTESSACDSTPLKTTRIFQSLLNFTLGPPFACILRGSFILPSDLWLDAGDTSCSGMTGNN